MKEETEGLGCMEMNESVEATARIERVEPAGNVERMEDAGRTGNVDRAEGVDLAGNVERPEGTERAGNATRAATARRAEQTPPELLAPAGDLDSFHAALAAGADAVYLGLGDFNARRNADNFTLDSLTEVCDLAHLAGRRVYLTLNVGILPHEFDRALELAGHAYRAGIDACIVQDIGLFTEVRQHIPQLELHASTQMNAHSVDAVRVLAQQGAKVVTLAREMSLAEVARAVEAAAEYDVRIEVFAHGALCLCYSGQCLMSSMIGGRSANRGLCAQPCRLPWHLIDTSTGKRVGAGGDYLLSPADLCTIDLLPALIETGVASLKIEGRMKSPEYVALVTSAYRSALDAAMASRSADGAAHSQVAPETHARLQEAFSRGFTTAYLQGERGNAMMSYQRPNNRGIQVGRVARIRNGLVSVDLEVGVAQGDVLEFWTNRGRCTVEVPSSVAEAEAGSSLALSVPKPVAPGDRVFRVRNGRLLKEAAALYDGSEQGVNTGFVPLDAQVIMQKGAPLCLVFSLSENAAITGAATGSLVEAARTRAVSREDIIEHVGRLGGTPYRIQQWDISLDEGVGIGFSELHRLRREALESLEAASAAPFRARVLERRKSATAMRIPARKKGLEVAVLVRDGVGERAAFAAGAEFVYRHVLDLESVPDLARDKRDGWGDQRGARKAEWRKVRTPIPVLPSICHDADTERLLAHVRQGEPVMVGNLAELDICREMGAFPEAASSLCVLNPASVLALADLGATRIWLSPELSLEDIRSFSSTSPLPLGITVLGQQELMVTEHCELMAKGPCAQECATCTRRRSPHLLEDRKGYRFPVRTDALGRGHIYNSIPLDLTASFPEIVSCGISRVLVDATLMTTKEIAEATARVIRARDIAVKHGDSLGKREGFTTGHFFKGVR